MTWSWVRPRPDGWEQCQFDLTDTMGYIAGDLEYVRGPEPAASARTLQFVCQRRCPRSRRRARRAGWAKGELSALGATLGRPDTVRLGFDANKFTPQLRTLDRYGHRLDEVEFHPAWHDLLTLASAGSPLQPVGGAETGEHVARAVGTYMLAQSKAAFIARSR